MAGIDYKKCDLCSERVFYDSDLNYEYDIGCDLSYFKMAGVEQNKVRLGNLGDWAVLCSECSKTHRTQIVLIE